MQERYNLEEMLEEIRKDQAINRPKEALVSQDEIKRMLNKKRQAPKEAS